MGKTESCARCQRLLSDTIPVHVLLMDSALTIVWTGCPSCAEELCAVARDRLREICRQLETAIGGNWWGRKVEDVDELMTPQQLVDKTNLWYLDLHALWIRGIHDVHVGREASEAAAEDMCDVLELFNAVHRGVRFGGRQQSSEPPPLTA